MKTIHNSDIRFELNPRIIYVSDFEMTFYTVSRGEYFFKKTDADVIEAEVSGDTKYYLDLDWSMLEYVGQGVLNYQCVNNIADPSFPDGEYNQLIEKTTDYFIDTFTVEPEGDESITDMIEKEVEERKEADTVISGAVDTEIARATSAETALQEAIDAETSARTSADETLQTNIDNEVSARTQADETLQNNIDAEASARTTADETLNNAITAETSARTAADEALSGAVDTKLQDYYLKSETSGKTEIQTALDGKSDTGHTHDERYYRKDETSGATELEGAFNRKLDASAYTPTDLSNYYTKDQTSGKSEIASALSAKLDVTAYTPTDLSNYYTKSETSGKSEISTALDGKVNSSDFDAAISEKANKADVYTKGETSAATQISTALAAKLDTTAYTPTDLSNYYTKSETSGATELNTAFSGKQDTLIAGDNITISGNVISAAGGDLSNYYTKSEVDEMSEVAAQGINDLNTNKLDVTAYTPTDLTNYYTKSETSGKTEIQTALGTKQDTLVSGTNIKTVNNESLLGSGNITIQGGGGNDVVELTQAEYDELVTSGTVDPDVFYVITDATPADLSQYWTSAQTQSAITQSVSGKQDTLSAGTGIDITSNVISVTGSTGGKAIEAGRGITVTTGETADTVSFNLPISAGTGDRSIIEGSNLNKATSRYSHAEGNATSGTGMYSHAEGYYTKAGGSSSHAEGIYTQATNSSSHAEGQYTKAFGSYSHSEGYYTTANAESSHVEGRYTKTSNRSEHASGEYNNSVSASTTFGDSGNTLFSVGNGTADNARHNAFEIRQNGDIYITSGGTDIKLQDNLGGGGSSINVVQTTGTSTSDVMSQNAVTTALSGYVTTDTEQTISGRKIFTYSANSGKAIEFKQTSDSSKVGFSIKNTADTNNEVASFEFRPNTITIDGVKRPLMYFGHFRNANTAAAGVPQTVIGFRQSDQANQSSYHFLMPLPEKAKTPFSLTTSFKDFYAPLGFKNGSTMISADETGVVDLSSIITGGTSINVVQTTGTSTGDVMSQDAVTTALSGKQGTLTTGHLVDITNGTISVDLPISAGTSGNYSMLIGAPDINSVASGDCAIASGYYNRAYGDYARADGQGNEAVGNYSYALGCYNSTANEAEFSIGKYNNGRVIYDGEGIVDYTVFTVGNGTSIDARHNAFEVRNSGDIYITSGNSDIKLQDYLGGVNSSTVQTMIDNSISGKADTTAVTTTLGNYYTKSQTSGASEITQALQAKANGSDVYLKSETSGATEITVALIDKADTSAVTAHTSDSTIHVTSANKTSWDGAATNASTAITNLGGLKLQQITQSAYDALTTKDASTLYVIVN